MGEISLEMSKQLCDHKKVKFLSLFFAFLLVLGGAVSGLAEEGGPKGDDRAVQLWKLGYLHHMQGDYRSAIAYYEASLASRPTAEAHTFLGWSLSHLGELERAIVECQKAIQLDPDFGNPYNDIGVYLLQKGRLDEAIPYLEKAIHSKRYCCYQFPHFNLGRLYVMKGQYLRALRSFRKALEIDPDYLPAQKALEELKGVMRET
jgi:tetratricopeptide (TPR) repeat protein